MVLSMRCCTTLSLSHSDSCSTFSQVGGQSDRFLLSLHTLVAPEKITFFDLPEISFDLGLFCSEYHLFDF